MGELRLRASARPDAQIAQDADLELLGQVGLGEGWSRLSPLIAHAQVEHLGPRRRGAVLGTAHATGRAVVGTARSTAAAQHDAADRSRVEVASSSYAARCSTATALSWRAGTRRSSQLRSAAPSWAIAAGAAPRAESTHC